MNEQASIAEVLHDIQQYTDFDVIVVDDASTDHTRVIAKTCGAHVLPHTVNMGAWRATQTGLRYAAKHGYKYAVSFDADGQHNAMYINSLLDKCRQGYSLVIGSYTARGSRGRHIAWRLFRYLTGLSVSDLTSGLRCYDAKAINALCSRQATMFEYQDVGVLLMLKHLKLKSVEIQVEMTSRQDGISRIFYSWLAVFKYVLYTLILSITKAPLASADSYKKKINME